MANALTPQMRANGSSEAYRFGGPHVITVADNGTTPTAGLDIRRYGMGTLVIDSGAVVTDATLTFTAAPSLDGTYEPVLDEDAAAIAITFAATEEGSWYTVPARIMEHHFIKPVFATSQTGGPIVFTFLGKT